MEKSIPDELIRNITSRIEDDIIKQSSFLLFSLSKRYSMDASLEAANDFLQQKGWHLKADDTDFLDNIGHKSIIDIEKWVDFNLKRIR
jgi:hypothetical protein